MRHVEETALKKRIADEQLGDLGSRAISRPPNTSWGSWRESMSLLDLVFVVSRENVRFHVDIPFA